MNSPVEFDPRSHLRTFLLKYSSLYTSENLMLLLHCILFPTTDPTTFRRQRSLVYPVRPLGSVSATFRPQHVELLPVRVLTHAHTHTLVNSLNLERVKLDEMITVMACCYVSMSCPVMARRHGWFLAWPPCHF